MAENIERKQSDTSPVPKQAKKRLNHHEVARAYRRYGRLYNFVFGAIMEPGRRQALRIMNCQPGEKVLEVGVGTGLALPYYPRDVEVFGIDLSPEMLRQAGEVVSKYKLSNVELQQMDAQDLKLADHSYDKVAIMYVASVVPDPKAMMAEARRVCRNDGDIFVLNHFASRQKIIRTGEKMLAPLANLVGFHSDFDLDRFLDESQVQLQSITPVNAFGYWKLLHFRNAQTPGQASPPAEPSGQSTSSETNPRESRLNP